ncbi:ubiquinone biosynthesis accessory factor UbiJ [Sulfurirhabdus autotrophica]|uniref:Ubiquinone biosynthesis accessory factor UbiJ n=1 Tax=Sulfurirhabdus autotrophica TaxID=1706046 RepID=A0A4R3Y8U9_9PROT|nr:SCP2 sterol-binding domain-containing protein [Sulfurirhabdus autotrophica]TCV88102.1 ubiquinone biosynthesis protein UbiJ [Sulfurirhabdus autotrophica]
MTLDTQEVNTKVSPSPFNAPPIAFVNHVLRGQSWALERLKPYAGKAAQFTVTPFSFVFVIQENGEFASTSAETNADVSLSFSSGVLLRIIAADNAAMSEVAMSGDTALAGEIGYIAKNTRWDAEEDLSRIFGDIVAHRMVNTAEKLWEWRKNSLFGFAQTLVEYWTEERPLLAKSLPLQKFIRDVDTLRDDAERLEKRIARLERQP